MAQRLQEKHSPELCVGLTRRHLRLNTQTSGADVLTSAIEPVVADVDVRISRVKTAEAEKHSCYDMTVFMDAELDNCVRTCAEKCMAYDRSNPGSQVYKMVFPDNTSGIINTYHLKESAEVQKVIARLETLDQSHPLRSEATVLRAVVVRVDETAQKYYDAIAKLAAVKAELDIAKTKLIRQYMANIFDAEKLFGRQLADRLFPLITTASAKDEPVVDQPAATVAN